MKKIYTLIILLFFINAIKAQEHFMNSGLFKVHPGATLALYGDFINNGSFADSGSIITFTGDEKQYISGTAPVAFNNLITDNPSGIVLQMPVTVKDALILANGPLNLNGNSLRINNNSADAVSPQHGYIQSEQPDNSGKVIWKVGNNNGSYTFPFGTEMGEYIPFILHHTAGDLGNITVSTYSTLYNNMLYPTMPVQVTNMTDALGSDLNETCVRRFWQVDTDGPNGAADMTFKATPDEVGSLYALYAQRWNDIAQFWDDPLPSQISNLLSATVPGVNKFGAWTLTGTKFQTNIDFVNFSATCMPSLGVVALAWETASEFNNEYFIVERSVDASDWSAVKMIKAAGNSYKLTNYSAVDALPVFTDDAGMLYYRLKNMDDNGRSKILKTILINKCEAHKDMEDISVAPNPFVTHVNVRYNNTEPEQDIHIHVRDMAGNVVFTATVPALKGLNLYNLSPGELAPGTYYITVMDSLKTTTRKIVKM